jgi:hypothetical protein
VRWTVACQTYLARSLNLLAPDLPRDDAPSADGE